MIRIVRPKIKARTEVSHDDHDGLAIQRTPDPEVVVAVERWGKAPIDTSVIRWGFKRGVFVAAALKVGVLPRLGAAMLGIGAVMFLTGRLMHGPFWSEGDPVPEGGVALLLSSSLVVLAAGWAVLGRKGRASGDDVEHRFWDRAGPRYGG